LTIEKKSTFLLLTATIIWGVSFVANRVAMDHISPFTFNGFRLGIAGILLLIISVFTEMGGLRRRNKDTFAANPVDALKNIFHTSTLIAGLITGSVFFAGAGLVMWGISVTGSASIAGFTVSMYVVLVPIIGIAVGRKTTRFVWLGVAVAVAGLYLIGVPAEGLGGIDNGVLILLGAAVCWSVQILVIDRFAAKVKPLHFATVQSLIASALSITAALLFEDIRISDVVTVAIPVLYTAVIGGCIGFTLQMTGQRHVTPARSAIIFSFEAVVAAIAEVVILGVFLDGRGYMGGGLIIVGIMISQIRKKKLE